MALKFITAEEAASLINNDDTVGFGGFTFAGAPKIVPKAIAKKAVELHEAGQPFKIGVITGASTGDELDGELARANAVKFRTPYQSCKHLRDRINKGEVSFLDQHLSSLAQDLRYGFGGDLDVAVVEACEVTSDGKIVPTIGVGIFPTICALAKKVIVELNPNISSSLAGFHDLIELQSPPFRREVGIYSPMDRIGKPYVQIDPEKIFVVNSDEKISGAHFSPIDDVTKKIGENIANFYTEEIRKGHIPKTFLPVQAGVGNIANAALAGMAENKEIPDFMVYTEVIQDAILDMIVRERVKCASGCSLTLSNTELDAFFSNINFFRDKVILRPVEISNNPEVVRRLGILAMNTAIEIDIFGGINSSHVLGTKLMNGIGGSGDFTRNAYISAFLSPSTAKDGLISCIVPKVVHEDHNEHSVNIVVTEYGVADLRFKSPRERANAIIENCAHPDYRPMLREYLRLNLNSHYPFDVYNCYSFHKAFHETGSMKNAIIDDKKK